MARNDPARVSKICAVELTNNIINSAKDERKRKRLQGLQFRIDMERQRARSPLAATIRISEMMCHSLADLHRSMVTPLVTDEVMEQDHASATVLAFTAMEPDQG